MDDGTVRLYLRARNLVVSAFLKRIRGDLVAIYVCVCVIDVSMVFVFWALSVPLPADALFLSSLVGGIGFAVVARLLEVGGRWAERSKAQRDRRVCVDCRWFRVDARISRPICASDDITEADVSPVSGGRDRVTMTCDNARRKMDGFVTCGPSGKFFERKEATPEAGANPANWTGASRSPMGGVES